MHTRSPDALENAATRLSPLKDNFFVEIIYKPSIDDNITNLCVFDDDQKIMCFMLNVDVFKDTSIDEDEHKKEFQDEDSARKRNLVLKGLVLLENLYDLQNHL